MVKVFSFCIYGDQKKYCLGLYKNIQLIQEFYPDFEVWIYGGKSVPEHYKQLYLNEENVKYTEINEPSANLKCHRFFPIDNPDVEILFSRDADSRITPRDRWCIEQFIQSDKTFHVIRDHYWHKMRIMAGTLGIRQNTLPFSIEKVYRDWISVHQNLLNTYNTDELFLTELIYPNIKSNVLIHSNMVGYIDEKITLIDYPVQESDFVGNVYDWNENNEEITQFKYSDYPYFQHLDWLINQQRWDLIRKNQRDIFSFSSTERYHYLLKLYYVEIINENYVDAQNILKLFRHTHIDEHIITSSNYLFDKLNKKIIGTTNPSRLPNDDEIVICYGNFGHDVDCLPHSNHVFRHAIYYNMIQHDYFECHPCWNLIDKIYIMNLPERRDRWCEILFELSRMNAPLDKIYHYQAPKTVITGDKKVDIYLDATKNHWDVVQHFLDNNYQYALFLEDDVTFTSRISDHQKDLQTFLERDYDFDLCFITASKYHNVVSKDDLISTSYQECTTSSGYILRKETAPKILDCFKEGYEKMKETLDYHTYVCDRYWAKIQKDNKMFVFNRKFGYQRCVYSSITGQVNMNFD